MARAVRLVLALVASTGLLVACGDDGPLGPSSAGPSLVPGADSGNDAPAVVEVIALDNTFRPGRLTVAPGTEVHFVNRGCNDHNTIAVEGGGWGVAEQEFGPGAEYVHRFDEPGTYRYYCSLHGIATFGMTGEIVVEDTGD